MVRVPPRVRIHRAQCLGTTAQVEGEYHRRLTVRPGHQQGNTTVARRAGPVSAATIALTESRSATTTSPTKGSAMSVHHLLTAADAALFAGGGLAAPATAHVSVAIAGYEIGVGRTVPTVAAVLGLIGVVIGGLARARSSGRIGVGNGRAGAVVALALGLISVGIGGVHAANSAGGLGTGNGLAGAILALVLGLVGMLLGGLVLARSRRIPARARRTG
jgi:hypothetical protein